MHLSVRNVAWVRSFGLFFGLFLLIIGVVSLISAYQYGDPAWEVQFQRLGKMDGSRYGMTIELFRLVLFVALATMVLTGRFSREMRLLLGWTERSTWGIRMSRSWRAASVTGVRVVFVTLVVWLAGTETWRILDEGPDGAPAQLIAWAETHTSELPADYFEMSLNQRFDSAWTTFLLYLPYSLVIWGVIVPLTVCVVLLALVNTDYWKMLSWKRRFYETVTIADGDANEIRGAFDEFSSDLKESCLRYSDVAGAVALAILFQQFLGNSMLPREARASSVASIVMIGAFFLFFLWVWFQYQDIWRHAREKMGNSRTNDGTMEMREQMITPQQFMKSIFKDKHNGYIVSALFLVPMEQYLPFL